MALALVVSLWSCTDHRLNENQQPRLRLKRTISTVPGSAGTTEFFYDAQGREASFVSGDYKGIFEYANTNRIQRFFFIIPGGSFPGEYNLFTYNSANPEGGVNVLTSTLRAIINGDYIKGDERRNYTLYPIVNQKGQFSEVPVNSPFGVTSDLTYAGNNLIQKITRPLRAGLTTNVTYEYDDKANPFYGLIGLEGVSGIPSLYNRNNVTKVTTEVQGNPTPQIVVTQYEYNAQGLPTKATTGGGEIRFEYETY
ncbi:hypothetical protein ACFSUS_04845 [Spirosoma soli]|uniref:YD repeat-containing protein n=2 Tax=Spirosoma soli TaxID=1770529 RepID=A0ABW5LZ38_9BACT